MALNRSGMWFYDIKNNYFFQKITKNRTTAAGSFALRPPFIIRLSYVTSLNTSPNLDISLFDFWFKF